MYKLYIVQCTCMRYWRNKYFETCSLSQKNSIFEFSWYVTRLFLIPNFEIGLFEEYTTQNKKNLNSFEIPWPSSVHIDKSLSTRYQKHTAMFNRSPCKTGLYFESALYLLNLHSGRVVSYGIALKYTFPAAVAG